MTGRDGRDPGRARTPASSTATHRRGPRAALRVRPREAARPRAPLTGAAYLPYLKTGCSLFHRHLLEPSARPRSSPPSLPLRPAGGRLAPPLLPPSLGRSTTRSADPLHLVLVLLPHQRGLDLGQPLPRRGRRDRGGVPPAVRDPGRGPFDVDRGPARAWATISGSRRCTPRRSPGSPRARAPGRARSPRSTPAPRSWSRRTPPASTECSTVIALPPGRPPVAVQTWDWYDAMADGWFTWTIPHPDGRVVQTVTEFGMLAKIGVNDRGVGVMLNMLHHRTTPAPSRPGRSATRCTCSAGRSSTTPRSVDEAVAIASAPRRRRRRR